MIVEEKKAHDMQCARNPAASFCFGSRCMAWRWADEAVPELKDDGLNIRRVFSTTHGYCGLAGRP